MIDIQFIDGLEPLRKTHNPDRGAVRCLPSAVSPKVDKRFSAGWGNLVASSPNLSNNTSNLRLNLPDFGTLLKGRRKENTLPPSENERSRQSPIVDVNQESSVPGRDLGQTGARMRLAGLCTRVCD